MSAHGRTAAVIGAGIAGLAVAALLQREGYCVTVFEASQNVGGRAGRWEQDGFRFDTGPSWYLMPEVFDHFYRLLGTTAHEQVSLTRLDPGYRVYFQGHDDFVDVAARRDDNVRLFERIEAGAGGRLESYLASAGQAYRLATERFLYSTYVSFRPLATRQTLALAPRLITLLNRSLERFVAARFTDRRLRQILGYPAVFLGSAPSLTPSLYHLMSHLDLEDGVWYPQGGFGEVIDSIARLADRQGVAVRTGAEVTEITTGKSEGRARVTGVEYCDASGVHRHVADVVVSAADLHHTETRLLPSSLRSYPEQWWAKRVSGPGAVLVLLGVRGTLPQLAHHSLFFTEDWADNFGRIFGHPTSVPNPASLYVSRTSATDPDTAPSGHENLFVLVPVPADPTLGGGGVSGAGDSRIEQIADAAIEQIAAWAGIPDFADRVVVRRTLGPADFERDLHSWQGGALGPAHTLRQSAFLRGSNASSKVDGLLYAGGSTIPGIGLPMCLISAELVIKRLRRDTTAAPLAEPL
ncbi:phytoene desaturase family protein [Microbacterium sp.]|uniref:phytoene desaturase family protein n=1 Tax=Microbacterium sp. TaxID=51671 RepID=UPI003A94C769